MLNAKCSTGRQRKGFLSGTSTEGICFHFHDSIHWSARVLSEKQLWDYFSAHTLTAWPCSVHKGDNRRRQGSVQSIARDPPQTVCFTQFLKMWDLYNCSASHVGLFHLLPACFSFYSNLSGLNPTWNTPGPDDFIKSHLKPVTGTMLRVGSDYKYLTKWLNQSSSERLRITSVVNVQMGPEPAGLITQQGQRSFSPKPRGVSQYPYLIVFAFSCINLNSSSIVEH